MDDKDLEFMKLAIEEARKSKAESERSHPFVGAVIVKDGTILGSAHRGELGSGDHAEFTVLEKKIGQGIVSGATAYVTLEPCTVRSPEKTPCARRLVDRKVKKVFIGMLDPNPKISGRGVRALREANIHVYFFPPELMAEIEELNRDFIKEQSEPPVQPELLELFSERAEDRSLNQWYHIVNYIYFDQNFRRDRMQIFSHLVEVTGTLSLLASNKRKPGIDPETFVAKALAWWMALCGKLGVKSVEDLVWWKFPHYCAYCHNRPHHQAECAENKKQQKPIDWVTLGRLGDGKRRPSTLGEWQKMFSDIYPVQQTDLQASAFARLTEELGELAEAIRVFDVAPEYFLSEAADVFAWLMHIQNALEEKHQVPQEQRGRKLESLFHEAYPDRCTDCERQRCVCPPILDRTIGRIAHEAPERPDAFAPGIGGVTVDRLRKMLKFPD